MEPRLLFLYLFFCPPTDRLTYRPAQLPPTHLCLSLLQLHQFFINTLTKCAQTLTIFHLQLQLRHLSNDARYMPFSAFGVLVLSLWQCECWPYYCPNPDLLCMLCFQGPLDGAFTWCSPSGLKEAQRGRGMCPESCKRIRMCPIIKTKEERVASIQWSWQQNALENSMEILVRRGFW